jgi:phosphoribosylaminoimidazolecarboxamide formyltransferase/IMP cyclohydrolase
MRYAILSVSDKTGVVDLARALVDRDYVVISTGGTARVLTAAGVPLRGVSEVTGVPEMMDGRVKTLHPSIHGGILARRDHPADLEAAARHGIGLIDLVVVNLYPFARAAATPDLPVADLLEEIDIGGPSLVRAAAKNFRDVLVVIDPADYGTVMAELDRPGGPSLAFRLGLARKAFAHTAHYDAVIAETLAELTVGEDGIVARVQPGVGPFPAALRVDLRKLRDLRYGENPHQPAAWYAIDAGPTSRVTGLQPDSADASPARGIRLQPGFPDVQILQGK